MSESENRKMSLSSPGTSQCEKRLSELIEVLESLKQKKCIISPVDDDEVKVESLDFKINELRDLIVKEFEEAEVLKRIKDNINAGFTLDEVLSYAYDSLHEIIPYNRIGCALINKNSGLVKTRWVKSDAEEIKLGKEYEAPLAGSSLEEVVKSGKPRIINDLAEYQEHNPGSESTQKILREGIRSSLTCPLIVNGNPTGFLFFSSSEPGTYNNAHVQFFEAIAHEISLVIEKGRLYQELGELNDLKSRLLGMAAHDLRNPLGVIRGYSQLLKMGQMGEVNEKQDNVLARIERNCNHMIDLIDDLLDISAIESGKLSLEFEDVNLADFFNEILQYSRDLAESKEIEINLNMASDLPRIRMDPDRIAQVVNNLISNAVKYSYPRSEIKIDVCKIDAGIEISVKDQGQGIPEDEIPLLFKGYSRGSAKPTAGEKSTGLGLAIVNNIIKAHGGKLKLISRVGEGSKFSAILPVNGPQNME